MPKMVEIYGPLPNNRIVETINGQMSYLDFLKSEEKRIKQNPDRTVNLINKLGFSRMYVDDIAAEIKKKREAAGDDSCQRGKNQRDIAGVKTA